MKLQTIMISALSIAAVTPAFAEEVYRLNATPSKSSGYGGTTDGSYSPGASCKTREEVYAELIRAQRDGIVPLNRIDYPPSQRTIDRNRELYQARH